MLVYVYDVLHIAKDAQEYMLKLKQVYQLEEGFRPPDIYLGGNFDKVKLEYGRTFWAMSCVEYLPGAINNVDSVLKGNNAALKSLGDVNCPYTSSYR